MSVNNKKKSRSGVEHRFPMTVRVSYSLRQDLQKLAKQLNRSCSAQASTILEEAVRAFSEAV
jgi:predicted transcriptional regulator